MNLIQVQNGHKAFGSRELFTSATFSINADEHVGVIGPNGAGKSTLFKILIGREHLDHGDLISSKSLRIGYLEQEIEWDPELTLEAFLSDCQMPIWELQALAGGLGLEQHHFSQRLMSLSGGYRMRARLLHLLGSEPNLMLLDEPTNYLDLETLLVLERFLQNYKGAFLLISHDREFLRRTTDHTLEIESQDINKYPGNIDDYFEQKALIREQLEKQAMSLAAKQKKILDFAARFGAKATKARQVQSRLKSLTKMESIEVKPLPVTAVIRIPEPERIGKKAISLKQASLGYGEKTILREIDLNLIRGDKIGVVGFNGVGKSTFLKGLAKVLEPKVGTIEYGMDVKLGYYAQHVAEELDLSSTVLDELQRSAHRSVRRQEILDMAGSLLFSGERVEMPISKLSGGEKARVALGKILLMRVPILLLDEVTNHLDFDTVEALTQALKAYQGTVIMVSHDRGFIQRVSSRILEIRNGKVLSYPGSYEEYVWSLQKGDFAGGQTGNQKNEKVEKSHSSQVDGPSESFKKENYKEKRKQLEKELRECEKRAGAFEKKIAELQKQIADLSAELEKDLPPQEKAKILGDLGRLPHEVIQLEEKWMLLLEEKEELSGRIKNLVEGARSRSGV